MVYRYMRKERVALKHYINFRTMAVVRTHGGDYWLLSSPAGHQHPS